MKAPYDDAYNTLLNLGRVYRAQGRRKDAQKLMSTAVDVSTGRIRPKAALNATSDIVSSKAYRRVVGKGESAGGWEDIVPSKPMPEVQKEKSGYDAWRSEHLPEVIVMMYDDNMLL